MNRNFEDRQVSEMQVSRRCMVLAKTTPLRRHVKNKGEMLGEDDTGVKPIRGAEL